MPAIPRNISFKNQSNNESLWKPTFGYEKNIVLLFKKKLFQANPQAELNELRKTVPFKVNIFYLLFYSIPFLYLI